MDHPVVHHECLALPSPPYLHLPALLLALLGGLLCARGVDRFPEGLVHLRPVLLGLVLGLAGQLVPTHLR